MAGMDVSGFWVKHWCEHMQQTYEEYGIQDQMVSSTVICVCFRCFNYKIWKSRNDVFLYSE